MSAGQLVDMLQSLAIIALALALMGRGRVRFPYRKPRRGKVGT